MKLFSRIYGRGVPVIILHGLFGMSDNWNSIAKRFSQYFNVHVLDLRNHGRSPHSLYFNYDLLSNDVLEYICDHQLNNPIIIGHSLGGKVAMKVSLQKPDKVSKLVVVDIAPRTYNIDFHKNILLALNKLYLKGFNERKEIDQELSVSIQDSRIRAFLLKNIYFDIENQEFQYRMNIESLLKELININDNIYTNQNSNIPALFLKGENSNYITIEDEELIHSIFSNAKIDTINKSGHWIHAENPNLFYDKVLEFCL